MRIATLIAPILLGLIFSVFGLNPFLQFFPAIFLPASAWSSGTALSIPAGLAPTSPVPLAEYFKIRRIGGGSFNFDESLIAYLSDEGGRMDIWIRPLERHGSP